MAESVGTLEGPPIGGDAAALRVWAREYALCALASMPARIDHVSGMLALAERVGAALELDVDLLLTVVALHDIGLAPVANRIDVPPLDAAEHLLAMGLPERLIKLVANSGCGMLEATIRGCTVPPWLTGEEPEDEDVRDALWYCCMSIDHTGAAATVQGRISGFRAKTANDPVFTEFIDAAEPALLGAVRRIEEQLERRAAGESEASPTIDDEAAR